jgi:hypothetical protein
MDSSSLFAEGTGSFVYYGLASSFNGPHVYLGNARIHHWMPGIIIGGIALLGATFDDNKENRQKYAVLGLVGSLLVLDDLPDFISFLQGKR